MLELIARQTHAKRRTSSIRVIGVVKVIRPWVVRLQCDVNLGIKFMLFIVHVCELNLKKCKNSPFSTVVAAYAS